MSTIIDGKIVSVADARWLVAYARAQGWLTRESKAGDSRDLDERPCGLGVQVIFVSEIARSVTVLHRPLIEPDDVKWQLAGQGAATVLNCAAQADIVRAAALCRVVR